MALLGGRFRVEPVCSDVFCTRQMRLARSCAIGLQHSIFSAEYGDEVIELYSPSPVLVLFHLYCTYSAAALAVCYDVALNMILLVAQNSSHLPGEFSKHHVNAEQMQL